jgi:hypothetical protein
MKVRVIKTLGDAMVETEVEDIELHQLFHVLMIAREGWVPTSADLDTLRKMES